jgi:valyl-tRNA synthetase
MLGDVAVAVNPKDERYKELIGEKLILPLLGREIPIVADYVVDPKFGTGAVKVTPAHDETDWQIGQRHQLPLIQVIDQKGRMTEETGTFQGLTISEARMKVIEELKKLNLLEKETPYLHRVGRCYKCNRIIEPMPKEQWFIKIDPLKKKAKELVIQEKIKIYPKRFKKILLQILENFYDWNISRQIVWGIRIPAYECKNSKIPLSPRLQGAGKTQMSKWFVSIEKPEKCKICGTCNFTQDEDTFDTWFSSGQWPFATLKASRNTELFDYFYPTSVMETGHDILRAWVARMIMIGYFITEKVPFENVFLHGMVRDKKGQTGK